MIFKSKRALHYKVREDSQFSFLHPPTPPYYFCFVSHPSPNPPTLSLLYIQYRYNP